MPTPTTDRIYYVVVFEDWTQAAAFVAALSRFLGSPRGNAYMAQPRAVEMWTLAPTSHDRVEVYLSDAARAALIAGFATLPIVETRVGAALPPDCTLVLGDQRASAWDLLDAERHLTTHS